MPEKDIYVIEYTYYQGLGKVVAHKAIHAFSSMGAITKLIATYPDMQLISLTINSTNSEVID